MKFDKEEIQKMVLGGMMLTLLIYCFFSFLLGPVLDHIHGAEGRIDELNKKISDAKGKKTEMKKMATLAPEAETTLKQLRSMIPEGSPQAWIPTEFGDFMHRESLEKPIIGSTEQPKKIVPGFGIVQWKLASGTTDFRTATTAIVDFENEELLSEIRHLDFGTSTENPEYVSFNLEIVTTVTMNE